MIEGKREVFHTECNVILLFTVFCLRYFSVSVYADGYPVFNATYGQGTDPIVMDGMKCVGSESTLQDCIFDPDASEDSHAEDAGVMCITGKPVAEIIAHACNLYNIIYVQ